MRTEGVIGVVSILLVFLIFRSVNCVDCSQFLLAHKKKVEGSNLTRSMDLTRLQLRPQKPDMLLFNEISLRSIFRDF